MRVIKTANLDTEKEFFSSGVQLIAGMDEVGRGSLAGPVSVGVALVSATAELSIEGLIDSKALSESRRLTMVPQIQEWVPAAVGHTEPDEIDALGMTRSLRLAGQRALAQVVTNELCPDMVLLDGKHDWLSAPSPDLLYEIEPAEILYQDLVAEAWRESPLKNTPMNYSDRDSSIWAGPVVTVIKGDYKCASIAAASVVAKVERDTIMVNLSEDFPRYGWENNKGYGAAVHQEALKSLGPTVQHRLSWNLGVDAESIKLAYLERMKINER